MKQLVLDNAVLLAMLAFMVGLLIALVLYIDAKDHQGRYEDL